LVVERRRLRAFRNLVEHLARSDKLGIRTQIHEVHRQAFVLRARCEQGAWCGSRGAVGLSRL
jgi:hypothetical protein